MQLRPTTAKVREALINIWRNELAGAVFLDLCTGTGAVAVAAHHAGARLVVAVDSSAKAMRNLAVCANREDFYTLRGTLPGCLGGLKTRFDLIYFDPPYASGLYLPTLAGIINHELLTSDGELAVEHHVHLALPAQYLGLTRTRQKNYGDTVLSFYQMTA
ncbi:N6-adenine-specific methylase [Gloeomargarita lithophora Alchichica-D10]|uniref:N6-adenine-specific methylase n=1 Tax=Gloeomargarita lithophora Alchichica-D10 TaxID=1188229 RepID=A0A1J0AE65_9CYAN|nr:RsmD family RNA methyltransferase [Gloeomargarita lithophora]APB34228.1 N6-adenine-specific methylase [Gloeomargarita lithophora Alchichica-D10]